MGIVRALVCDAVRAPSDAILVDNFESTYRVFERAAELRRAGVASRVFVQTLTDPNTQEPEEVALARVRLMATIAGLGNVEIVRARPVEPITLNAGLDMQRVFERQHVRSVVFVSPLLRSRRSALVYAATLGQHGIAVRCEPVEGSVGVNNWTRSWHGIEAVTEQWLKLQYYRWYVLPFANPRTNLP